jgi:RES domain
MAAARKCCATCFGDRGLRNDIIPSITSSRGTCSYCSSVDELLVSPSELADVFGLLVNSYAEDPAGRPIVELFKEDWLLFDHPAMSNAQAKELLADILDDGEIVRRSFVPSPKYQSDRLALWRALRTELMHENRYFPATPLDTDRLRELLDQLHADPIPSTWFRARLQTGDDLFDIKDMGAPPKRIAGHGRANPAGIPYLYLGSAAETAVAEVRPHTGEKACVADFTVPAGLQLVDLRDPRKLVSPFLQGSEDDIGRLRSDIAFLEQVGQELTRPIVPMGASIDYVPSQYLCEFIKKCGYAGVLYRSSVSSGFNLALFNPTVAAPGRVAQFNIECVTVAISAVAP